VIRDAGSALRLLDLVNALLDHFVYTTGLMFWQNDDYQIQGNVVSILTEKGNETVGALSTVIHVGSIFLAQLMLLLVYPFNNVTNYVSGPG